MLPEWLAIRPLAQRRREAVSNSIGPGEHEVISLGLELRAERLILDEQPARRLATAVGLRVIGTVGLLIGKDRGLLTKIKPELDRLVSVRFFMDQERYGTAMRQAGE